MRAEIKASALIHNGGDLRELGLSEKARHFIYRGMLQLQPKIGLETFAVVIDKRLLRERRPNDDPSIIAWTYLMQRLERLTRRPQDQVLLLHDEGETETIKQIARKFRRFGTAGSLLAVDTRFHHLGAC